MKTTHVRLKKTLTLSAAGKLALGASVASAGGLGKSDTFEQQATVPPLTLDQLGYPLDLLMPPTSGLDQENAGAALGKAGTTTTSNLGSIFMGEIASFSEQPRIDFVVNNVRADRTMQVLLAYSTAPGDAGYWNPMAQGRMLLDPATIQVIGIVTVTPDRTLGDFPATPLGTVPPRNTGTVVVPVDLSDLSDASFSGNEIWFQAAAIPVDDQGNVLWDQGQASELDHYVIERVQAGIADSGSKSGLSSGATGDGKTGASDLFDPGETPDCDFNQDGTVDEWESSVCGMDPTSPMDPLDPMDPLNPGDLPYDPLCDANGDGTIDENEALQCMPTGPMDPMDPMDPADPV